MAKRKNPFEEPVTPVEDPNLSRSAIQFRAKKLALERIIVGITDKSMELSQAERDRVKPGVSAEQAKTDPDIVEEQQKKSRALASDRITKLFRIKEDAHPEFHFVYPPVASPPDQWGFVTTTSSLKDGVWAAIIRADNEPFWADRVAELKFVQHNATEKGLFTLGYHEMVRVVGAPMVNKMLAVVDVFALQDVGTTDADRNRVLRTIFLNYLRSYLENASLSFLTLFVHNLLLTPRYVTDQETGLLVNAGNSLVPVQEHLDHLIADPPAWLKRKSDAMDEEESTTASSSTRTKEERMQEEEVHVEPEPTRPYDPRRKTSLLLGSTRKYFFITTLELHLADTTLRYEIYQPGDGSIDTIQYHDDFPVLYINLYLEESALHPLQLRVNVGAQVQRVFKFYYKADHDYLILYVALSKGGMLVRVPCRTMANAHITPVALFDETRFNDVFYIDAVGCPYEATFCTWQKASARLEPVLLGNGLQIMTTAAIYQRTMTNVAAASTSGSDAWREEMRTLTGKRQEKDTAMTNMAEQIKSMTKEADRKSEEAQAEIEAIQQEIKDITARLADKSPNGARPTQIPVLNKRLTERKQALATIQRLVADYYVAVEAKKDEWNRVRDEHKKISDEIIELNKMKRGYKKTSDGAPVEAPLSLPIGKMQPIEVRVQGMVMARKRDRYVAAVDIDAATPPFAREQRIVHACKVITIPGDGSGVEDPTLRADVGNHCVQLKFNADSGKVERRITYATVAVLCERPNQMPGTHIFEVHFYKFELNGAGTAYVPMDGALDAEKEARDVRSLVLHNPTHAFRVTDFEVVFYDDNLGRSFCIQADIEDMESGERYTTCSQSRYELLGFNDAVRRQEATSVPQNLLALFDLLSYQHGYRTVRFHTSDLARVRFNYMFYKQYARDTVRFIFMKLGGPAPSVFQIDVEGIQLEWISSFAPFRKPNDLRAGFLYLMLDVPVQNQIGDVTGSERRVLELGVNEDMPGYEDRNEPWFLTSQLSRMNLQAGYTPMGAHQPCTWCNEPTTMQDDATHRYYCDGLCQALLCTTKRLM